MSSDPIVERFMQDGRIVLMPSKSAKRRVVLAEVAQRFAVGRAYAESEVNEILADVHADYAALRRYLVDEGMLQRESGIYTRLSRSPS